MSDRNEYIEPLVSMLMQSDAARIEGEAAVYRRVGSEKGFESLQTNEIGRRTIDYLSQYQLAFYSGLATSCMVAAVGHPEIGVGVAHLNTVTEDGVREYITHFLSGSGRVDTRRLQQLMTEPPKLLRTIVSADTRRTVVWNGMNDAFEQFNIMSGGALPRDTKALVCGMFYLDQREQKALETDIYDFAKQLGNIRGKNVHISIRKDNGVIMGASNHPHFRRLGFFNGRDYRTV
jgi:hypothetical protein